MKNNPKEDFALNKTENPSIKSFSLEEKIKFLEESIEEMNMVGSFAAQKKLNQLEVSQREVGIAIAARLDDRIHALERQLQELDNRIDRCNDAFNLILGRVMVLESHESSNDFEKIREEVSRLRENIMKHDISLGALQLVSNSNDNKLKNIFDYVIKTGWILLLTYIVWKLGLSAPPFLP